MTDDIAAPVEPDQFDRVWAREVIAAAEARVARLCALDGRERVLKVMRASKLMAGHSDLIGWMSKEFGVSARTIYRDLDLAQQLMIQALEDELAEAAGGDPERTRDELNDFWRIAAR